MKNETQLFSTLAGDYRLPYFLPRSLASKWIISLILSLVQERSSSSRCSKFVAANCRRRRSLAGEPDCRPFPRLVARLIVQKRINRQAGTRASKRRARIWVVTSGVKSLRAISKRSFAALCHPRQYADVQVAASRNGINTSVPQYYSVILSPRLFSLYGHFIFH